MFNALRTTLTRWFGAPSSADKAAPDSAAVDGTIVADYDTGADEHDAFYVAYDENLLDRARTQWQFGDWESLAALGREQLQHHPERGKLALLAAAGLLQTGGSAKARTFVHLAQDWGMSKRMISRILIAGVHNTIGRAAAVSGQEQRALGHFETSVATGATGGDVELLAEARARREMGISRMTPASLAPIAQINGTSQILLPQEPVLISEGYEAYVYGNGKQVFKVYKSAYFEYNKEYCRSGEGIFLKNNPSKFFVTLIEDNPFFIAMPYAGKQIGDKHELHCDSFNCKKFRVWVSELKDELIRLGIKHRDINPTNILYHREYDKFTLIDFGWAIGSDEFFKENPRPEGMNPYGPSDNDAIEKMIASVTQYIAEAKVV